MREIKFRAWDTDLAKLIPLKVMPVKQIDFSKGIETDRGWFTFRDDVILMQYTGLKDKNGKEIYEGDIVNRPYVELSVIAFHEGGFFYKALNRDSYANIHSTCEIIGNIYENPELMK